jgi:hypothetical protein
MATETDDEKKPKKPRKAPERKPLYVLMPVSEEPDAPYRIAVVKSKPEVTKALEAAHIDGKTPVAMSRVMIVRGISLSLKLSTQTVIRF